MNSFKLSGHERSLVISIGLWINREFGFGLSAFGLTGTHQFSWWVLHLQWNKSWRPVCEICWIKFQGSISKFISRKHQVWSGKGLCHGLLVIEQHCGEKLLNFDRLVWSLIRKYNTLCIGIWIFILFYFWKSRVIFSQKRCFFYFLVQEVVGGCVNGHIVQKPTGKT